MAATMVMGHHGVTPLATPITTLSAPQGVSPLTTVTMPQTVMMQHPGMTMVGHPGMYAHPMPHQHAVVQHTAAPVTTVMHRAAPTAHHMMVPQHNLLAAGPVVSERHLHREDLLQTGHLIEDVQAEMQLLRQGQAIPGAMAGPHTVVAAHHAAPTVVQHTQQPQHTVVQHTTQPVMQAIEPVHHIQHAQPAVMQHVEHGPPEAEGVEVQFLQANNLVSMNKFTGDNMYVECIVVHKTGNELAPGHVPSARSNIADHNNSPDPLNPVWNEAHVIEGYFPGDSLEFTICDQGMMGHRTEGKILIDAEHFHEQGFDGDLPIDGLPHATLSVRIRVLGPLSQLQQHVQ